MIIHYKSKEKYLIKIEKEIVTTIYYGNQSIKYYEWN